MVIFLNRSMAPAGSPFSISNTEAREELGVGRRLAARELGGERPPGGDGLVEFLLGQEALADLEEDAGHACVERILGDEFAPGGARLGIASPGEMVGGDQKLGVEDRALGVGTLGAVGEIGQVSLPGGDRLR